MHSRLRLSVVSIPVLLLTSLAYAQTTRNVPGQFPTIQAAIDAAVPGDSVVVQSGTYLERNISFRGKAITVRSQAGPTNCIINAQNLSRHFVFNNGEGQSTRLIGFTLINGHATGVATPPPVTSSLDGGSILCLGASPTILECYFSACVAGQSASATVAPGSGGAIFIGSAAPVIERCVFVDCAAGAGANGSTSMFVIPPIPAGPGGFGGGIGINNGTPVLRDNLFVRCNAGQGGTADTARAGGGGGAIAAFGSQVLISNTTFSECRSGNGGNGIASGGRAGEGGGIFAVFGVIQMDHSVFENCRGANGGFGDTRPEGGTGGAFYFENVTAVINTCQFRDNFTGRGGASGVSILSPAGVPGGAIYLRGGNTTIRSSVFLRNQASNAESLALMPLPPGGSGGGIFCDGGMLTVEDSTFARNRAGASYVPGTGGAIATGPVQPNWRYVPGGYTPSAASVVIRRCIFREDFPAGLAPATLSVSSSNIQGSYAGLSNLDVDPLFVDLDAGDVHLRFTSPMIDAGGIGSSTPATLRDIDQDPRTVFGIRDIGADEFVLGPCRLATNGANNILRIDGLSPGASGYLRRSANSPLLLEVDPGMAAAAGLLWGQVGIPSRDEAVVFGNLGFCVPPDFLIGQPDAFLLANNLGLSSLFVGAGFPWTFQIPHLFVPITISMQGVFLTDPAGIPMATNAFVLELE